MPCYLLRNLFRSSQFWDDKEMAGRARKTINGLLDDSVAFSQRDAAKARRARLPVTSLSRAFVSEVSGFPAVTICRGLLNAD